jgi:hypothetical protein
MLIAILETENKDDRLRGFDTKVLKKCTHLTTAPVESRSLAICGIEGVNVPIRESILMNKNFDSVQNG